ncbi:UDP-glucuronosyltransferase [Aphelenchoides bicaudatus]|nr:UDP-glucuronosyltransferase [Aphelenchoides bicaudatus]
MTTGIWLSLTFCSIPHGYAIALRLHAEKGVKYVLMDTGGAINQIGSTSMSLGRSLVTKPFTYPLSPTTPTDIFDPKLFTARLYNVLISSYNYAFSFVIQDYFLPTVFEFGADFTYYKLYYQAECMFTEMFDRIGYSIAETHFLKNIGARCPDITKRTLPAEVKKFVNDPKSKGTIYIAFGSYVNWIMAPDKIVQAFGNTMKKLHDYRFVFVNNAKSSPLPLLPNVLYLQWTDQIAVLNHPKTKLFITHGGFKSTKEGLCSETPLLAIPLFAEQLYNSNNAVKDNYGRVLNKFTLDDHQLYNTLKMMLDDQGWQNRLKRIKSVLLDRPISSLDAAFHYTQRAIKQKRNFSKNLPISWSAYLYMEHTVILTIAILFIK